MSDTTATAFVSLDDAKQWIGVKGDDFDQQIALLADAVSAFIERHTGRTFVQRTYTAETYNGSGTNFLRLRHFPVVSVTTLTVTRTEDGSPETLTEGTDFDVDTVAGLIKLRSVAAPFDRLFQNVSITYVAGQGVRESIDVDARALCLEMLKIIWHRHRADTGFGSVVTAFSSGSLVQSEAWPRHIQSSLRDLRRVSVS